MEWNYVIRFSCILVATSIVNWVSITSSLSRLMFALVDHCYAHT